MLEIRYYKSFGIILESVFFENETMQDHFSKTTMETFHVKKTQYSSKQFYIIMTFSHVSPIIE